MRYTIEGFSQEKLLELGLDTTDAHLLRWFVDFRDTDKMITVIRDEKVYYWVNYAGIIRDLPILNIDKRAIQRRFKKLVNANILLHYTHRVGGVYSCYNLKDGGNYSSLVEKPSPNKQKNNDPIGFESTNPMDLKVPTKDSSPKTLKLSTISLKNEKGSRKDGKSAFCCAEFLKIYLKEYRKQKGKEHPSVTEEQANTVLKAIDESGIRLYGKAGAKVMIQDYFLTVKCDHNINHFVSGSIIHMRIERYKNDLCLEDASLYFQVECYRGTGRFTEKRLDFLELYAKKYLQHKGETHPAMKLEQLRKCFKALASWDFLDSLNMEEALDNFFKRMKKSDCRLHVFASEGVMKITNYHAM